MPEVFEEKTLLQSLLDCFASSKTVIKYVIERDLNGHKKYDLPLNNIVEWWKLLFSKNIVALSIAPRSHDKQLSKDALSAFVRYIINDKNKSIVEKNLIPHFKGPHCHDLISGEVSHLEHTIDLGVRAAYSSWDAYSDTLSGEKLKESADVQIHYEDAVRFLMQLFCGAPYEILLDRYSWFAECINTSSPEIDHYSTNQILTIFACALILCLNITEVSEVNANIESYIKSVISLPENGETHDEESAPRSKNENIGSHQRRESQSKSEKSGSSSMDATILKAALKINLYEIKHGRTPLDESAELIIKGIIDSIMADLYDDILSISAQLWNQFNIEQKAQAILKAYVHELSSINDLSLTDTNTRI